jgi:hypothetical protein
MRKGVIHGAIACCTFAFSVALSIIWSWGVQTVTPGRFVVRDAVSIYSAEPVVSLEPGVWTSQPRADTAEPGLLDIYRRYGEAQTNHDIEFFLNVQAEDYVLFSGGGKTMARRDTIDWLKNSPPNVDYRLDDVKIKLYGHAAVVTGRVTATDRSGSSASQRWIDVCVKRDGHWQIQSTTQLD